MKLPYVVVGVDGSLHAIRALDRAADEAARREAELRLVYAVPDSDEAGPILASAVARVHARRPGLRVAARAVQGGAVRALTEESDGAALTVVGTRGFGGIGGTLFGSVSLRLAAHVRGPLMVVRGDHPWEAALDAGRDVLLGLQGDADADAAVYAFEEAERRRVWLRVVHSWDHRHITPEPPSPVPATSPGQQSLARYERSEEAVARFALARLRAQHPRVGVDARSVRTGPAHALLEASERASVVVIGAHRRTGRFTPHLGSVAHTLLHHSHCPVVLVPTES
ncbi:universal stress protein [Streptomyces sp. NPDC005648]|uniref:universal stress protein n=1 Tax=Streptomyces sp. NPDC005648 TaxID=3157044 RepID=UPI0033B4A45F